jgi:uncharacterized protein YggE
MARFGLLCAAALALVQPVSAAQVQLQLSCSGAVLEARGSATLRRTIDRLRVELRLEADASSASAALQQLQQRLEAVRRSLQSLQIQELRVTSPSVWQRAVAPGRPAQFDANAQVSGKLAPEQLQRLISEVGGLPGVRLAPVEAQADASGDAAANRQLMQAAYRDALQQAQMLAAALGLRTLRPLQAQADGGVRPGPMLARARGLPAPAAFDPRELSEPTDQLSLAVTFCATR